MNETLQTVMTFINEHTLLLIGICVFLILVLVGYLIDNSVKSKRIRNDIKNKDQVPENIKDEIIKEAEQKEIKKENVSIENNDLNLKNTNTQDSEVKLDEPLTFENVTSDENDLSFEKQSNETPELNLDASNDILNIQTSEVKSDVQFDDPDFNLMNAANKNEYTNDKKLSEILFDAEKTQEENNSNSIFNNDSTTITINNDVKKDDVQIQTNNSTDELDRIMRKLSTMNETIEDDNYTNIF